MVRHLVDEYGADVNLTNGSFKSMLTIAIIDRNEEAIKFLVEEMKADIDIQVKNQWKTITEMFVIQT
jgi:hypothetical protein